MRPEGKQFPPKCVGGRVHTWTRAELFLRTISVHLLLQWLSLRFKLIQVDFSVNVLHWATWRKKAVTQREFGSKPCVNSSRASQSEAVLMNVLQLQPGCHADCLEAAAGEEQEAHRSFLLWWTKENQVKGKSGRDFHRSIKCEEARADFGISLTYGLIKHF